MKQRPSERDVRPSESVSRINYWDNSEGIRSSADRPSAYDWIYERLLERVRATSTEDAAAVQWGFGVSEGDAASLSQQLDFVLLHEFKGADFFDWHTDTKPGDGTGRTVNVNVMLSSSSSSASIQGDESQDGGYSGGGLLVGDCDVRPQKGDLYWYPAGYPHKVADVEGGERHTLVLAVKVEDSAREATDYWERCEANFLKLTCGFEDAKAKETAAAAAGGKPKQKKGAEVLPAGFGMKLVAEPWRQSRPLRPRSHSKWHFLFGEHLAAQGRDAEADEVFADAYASTEQAAEYALKFDEDGQRLAAGGRIEESLPFFKLAARIDSRSPTSTLYKAHLKAIEVALKGPSA